MLQTYTMLAKKKALQTENDKKTSKLGSIE